MYECIMQERAIFILFICFQKKNKMKFIACGQNVKSLYLDENDDLIFCIIYMMMMMLIDRELNNNYRN